MKRSSLLLLACFFLVLLAGCSSSKEDKTCLRINLHQEPSSLDPLHVRNLSSLFLARHLHEGLFRYDNDHPKEALAQSYEISECRTKYKITLKEALFSDGTKITASDFVNSVKRALLDEKCDYAHLLFVLKNAKTFRQTKDIKVFDSVRALSENCLEYELEYPHHDFLGLLTHPVFFPTKVIDGVLLSSGPFVVEEHQMQNKIRLRKNKNYVDAAKVHLNSIEGLILSHETALSLFENGMLDFIGSPLGMIPQDSLNNLNLKKVLNKKPWLGVCFLRLNTKKFESKFRKALASCIDQDQIVEKALNGQHLATRSFLPSNFGLNQKKHLSEDFTCLETISHNQGSISLKFSSSDARMQIISCLIKNYIEKKLGFIVNLVPRESKMLLQDMSSSDFDMILGSWIADVFDPENFLDIFSDKNLMVNGTGWQNPRFEELLKRAKNQSVNKSVYYEQAQNLLLEESPIIPLFQFNLIYAKDETLENFSLNSLGILDFSFAKLKR